MTLVPILFIMWLAPISPLFLNRSVHAWQSVVIAQAVGLDLSPESPKDDSAILVQREHDHGSILRSAVGAIHGYGSRLIRRGLEQQQTRPTSQRTGLSQWSLASYDLRLNSQEDAIPSQSIGYRPSSAGLVDFPERSHPLPGKKRPRLEAEALDAHNQALHGTTKLPRSQHEGYARGNSIPMPYQQERNAAGGHQSRGAGSDVSTPRYSKARRDIARWRGLHDQRPSLPGSLDPRDRLPGLYSDRNQHVKLLNAVDDLDAADRQANSFHRPIPQELGEPVALYQKRLNQQIRERSQALQWKHLAEQIVDHQRQVCGIVDSPLRPVGHGVREECVQSVRQSNQQSEALAAHHKHWLRSLPNRMEQRPGEGTGEWRQRVAGLNRELAAFRTSHEALGIGIEELKKTHTSAEWAELKAHVHGQERLMQMPDRPQNVPYNPHRSSALPVSYPLHRPVSHPPFHPHLPVLSLRPPPITAYIPRPSLVPQNIPLTRGFPGGDAPEAFQRRHTDLPYTEAQRIWDARRFH